MILTYILRVMMLTLPITWFIVNAKEGGWRYGFTFIQNNFEVALFVSFAVSFLLAMYHAISFDELEGAPNQNYMKSTQHVHIRGNRSLKEVAGFLIDHRKYKNVSFENENKLVAKRNVHLLSPDKVIIEKEGDLFRVTSAPFTRLWFIDFGRNYKNVKQIAKYIKEIK